MGEKWDDREFKDIAWLIREDEDRALEIFRQRNFDQTIRTQVAAVSDRKHSFSGLSMAVPVSVAVLLLIALGTVLLVTWRPSPGPRSGPGPIALILKDLPGVSDFVMPRETLPAGAAETFGPARTVRIVLAMATRQKMEEERRAAAPTGNLKVPRLSLEKKMQILFKERPIERVLVSILKKSEEV
jgi:hypothetical protein